MNHIVIKMKTDLIVMELKMRSVVGKMKDISHQKEYLSFK